MYRQTDELIRVGLGNLRFLQVKNRIITNASSMDVVVAGRGRGGGGGRRRLRAAPRHPRDDPVCVSVRLVVRDGGTTTMATREGGGIDDYDYDGDDVGDGDGDSRSNIIFIAAREESGSAAGHPVLRDESRRRRRWGSRRRRY
jgi:hypothetical protein